MTDPDVRGVRCNAFITDSAGRVLLVLGQDHKWGLPGGCQNPNETPAQRVAQACHEQTGYSVTITKLLGVFGPAPKCAGGRGALCRLLFRAKVAGGEARASGGVLSVRWFFENDLRNIREDHMTGVRFGFKCLRDPSLPVRFE